MYCGPDVCKRDYRCTNEIHFGTTDVEETMMVIRICFCLVWDVVSTQT